MWSPASSVIGLTLTAAFAAGFGGTPALPKVWFASPVSTGVNRGSCSTSTTLWGIRCEGKTYQLEEMEDKETSTTEVFLNFDRSVTVGQTDGPPWIEASGSWEVVPGTNDFKMSIKRKFGTGQVSTDMGEFEYDVERTFIGEMTNVGESVGITGVMHSKDVDADDDQEVGFFNMIDGTDEKASYKTKADKLQTN